MKETREFATKAYKVSRDKRKKVEMLFAHLKRIVRRHIKWDIRAA